MILFKPAKGPVEEFWWARFLISGEEHGWINSSIKGAGKDIRIIGTDVTEWKERSSHILTIEMITSVFDIGIETLIIGNGIYGTVNCSSKVKNYIQKRGIKKVLVLNIPQACKIYNELFHNKVKVAMLTHGIC